MKRKQSPGLVMPTLASYMGAPEEPKEQVMIDGSTGSVSAIEAPAARIQPIGDAFAVEPDASKPPSRKTPQKPAKQAEKKPKAPWDGASEKVLVTYSFRMSELLHKKMFWITENVPRHSSLQKIISKATTELVEKLIKEHYEP